jgi:hypothetical protein
MLKIIRPKKTSQIALVTGSKQNKWGAGSIPDEVIGFFSVDLILPAALGPGVYSASNRNEYQELIKNNFPGE